MPRALTSPVVMCVSDLNCSSFWKAREEAAARKRMPVRWLMTQQAHMLRDFMHSVKNRARHSPTPYPTPPDRSWEYSRIFGIIST